MSGEGYAVLGRLAMINEQGERPRCGHDWLNITIGARWSDFDQVLASWCRVCGSLKGSSGETLTPTLEDERNRLRDKAALADEIRLIVSGGVPGDIRFWFDWCSRFDRAALSAKEVKDVVDTEQDP